MTRSFFAVAFLSSIAAAQYPTQEPAGNLEAFPSVVNDYNSAPSSYETPSPNSGNYYNSPAPAYESPAGSYEPPTYVAPGSYESPTYVAPGSYGSPTYVAPGGYESAPPTYESAPVYSPPTYQSEPPCPSSEAPVPVATETSGPVYGQSSSEAPSPTYVAPTLVTYASAAPLGTGGAAPFSNGTGGNATYSSPTVRSLPQSSSSAAFESGANTFTVKLPVILAGLGLVFAML